MKKITWGDKYVGVIFDSEAEKVQEVANLLNQEVQIEDYIEYQVFWSVFELSFESYEEAMKYVKELVEEGYTVSIRKVT